MLGFVRPSRQKNFREDEQVVGKPNLSCMRGGVAIPHPPKAVFVLGLQPFGLPLPALKACFPQRKEGHTIPLHRTIYATLNFGDIIRLW
ncbi:MAG: hypothetical protein FJZ16_04845 [Candidatus Omnitrophica bacterium]|nr:hypothetical protein [Candidatus Omnitrophota bacterium]